MRKARAVILASTFLALAVPRGWTNADWEAHAFFDFVAVDRNGDAVAVGAFVGSDEGTGTQYAFGDEVFKADFDDHFDLVLARYDESGEVMLAKVLGWMNWPSLAFAPDPSGGFVLAHASWLWKSDASGRSEWEKSGKGTISDVAVGPAGDVYLVGDGDIVGAAAALGGTGLVPGAVLVGCSPQGVPRWAVSSSGCSRVVPDGSGNVLMAGAVEEPGRYAYGRVVIEKTEERAGAVLAKADAEGSFQWAVLDMTCAVVTAIVADRSGNLVVAGKDGAGNALLMKYDPRGNLLWRQVSAEPGLAYTDASTDPGGDVYLAGQAGSHDAFIARYAASGTPVWTKLFTETDYTFTSLAVDEGSGVYAAGAAGRRALLVRLSSAGSVDWVRTSQ